MSSNIRLTFISAVLLLPAAASAHAMLRTALPPVGSTVHIAPTQIVLRYSEGVEPLFSTVAVTAADGTDVTASRPHLGTDEEHLTVALKPLGPGKYTVTWHATSVDTHKTQGSFSFTVTP